MIKFDNIKIVEKLIAGLRHKLTELNSDNYQSILCSLIKN